MKKLLATMLTLCMLAATLTGCGGNTDPSSSSQTSSPASGESSSETVETRDVGGLTLPLTEEKKELSVFAIYMNNVYSDPNDLPGIQELENRTNVHINWSTATMQEMGEKYPILLSSGDLPDILYPGSNSYPGGIAKGVEDGVIIDMDPIIRENMPNYMAILESNEEARREATSDEGKLDSVRIMVSTDTTIEPEGTYLGLAFRKDIFDTMGMELPETVDQWEEVLKACKDAGMTAAFYPSSNGGSNLSLAYGVSTNAVDNYLQLEGDTVVSSAMQDGFGEYLEKMRSWYEQGLIYPNFTSGAPMMTNDYSTLETDQTMLYNEWLTSFCGDTLVNNKIISNQSVYLQPISNPVENVGDEPIECFRQIIAKDPIFITTACEDPVLAAKWLDYWWSEEGSNLAFYGIEGVTYEIGEDGTPQYTDLIANNPDGMIPGDAIKNYAFCANGGSWMGRHNVEAGSKLSALSLAGSTDVASEATEIFSSPETNIWISESISFTDDEGVELSSLQTAVNTMIEEYMVNYITGTDTTSFDDFRNNLQQYGVERICEIYQAAYDRYLAR